MTIRRVGLIARQTQPATIAALLEAAAWLETHGAAPVLDAEVAAEAGIADRWPTLETNDLPAAVDALVVFGGDGSLLSAASVVAHAGCDTPLMGVNLGRLGFLTEVNRSDMLVGLAALVEGRTRTETRMLLHGRVVRDGRDETAHLALNDIVVTRGALSRMIEIDVTVDGQPVFHVKADGLIVATATGSTAYNLSAGGPILHPAVDAIVLTPIAPHALTNRPLVLPATAELTLRPEIDPRSDIVVTFDGQYGAPLAAGDVVVVTRASRLLRLVRTSDRTHFDMLREKLQWGR
ncbi:MAG: NAD(+)/NADH kinase [Vicinamibacterales bacterium]